MIYLNFILFAVLIFIILAIIIIIVYNITNLDFKFKQRCSKSNMADEKHESFFYKLKNKKFKLENKNSKIITDNIDLINQTNFKINSSKIEYIQPVKVLTNSKSNYNNYGSLNTNFFKEKTNLEMTNSKKLLKSNLRKFSFPLVRPKCSKIDSFEENGIFQSNLLKYNCSSLPETSSINNNNNILKTTNSDYNFTNELFFLDHNNCFICFSLIYICTTSTLQIIIHKLIGLHNLLIKNFNLTLDYLQFNCKIQIKVKPKNNYLNQLDNKIFTKYINCQKIQNINNLNFDQSVLFCLNSNDLDCYELVFGIIISNLKTITGINASKYYLTNTNVKLSKTFYFIGMGSHDLNRFDLVNKNEKLNNIICKINQNLNNYELINLNKKQFLSEKNLEINNFEKNTEFKKVCKKLFLLI